MNSAQPSKILPPDKRNFAARLFAARNAADLTQEQLGRKIGISPSVISNWEKEKVVPTNMRLVRQAERALNLEPGHLTVPLGFIPATAQNCNAIELQTLLSTGRVFALLTPETHKGLT
jgi:transcriptional regulator with XRE-family HTH domain